MPRIRLVVHQPAFRFLWLRYVTGFDPRHHCVRCLLGRPSRLLRPYRIWEKGVVEGLLDEHPADYLYLCGVTGRYDENLHIAMRPEPGAVVEYAEERIEVRVEGAERLPITPIDLPLPEAFLRCRNFQFGVNRYGWTIPPAKKVWNAAALAP